MLSVVRTWKSAMDDAARSTVVRCLISADNRIAWSQCRSAARSCRKRIHNRLHRGYYRVSTIVPPPPPL